MIRRAATILVLRQRGDAVEVLLVRRHSRASFMAGAHVFPGGCVDPADEAAGHDQADQALQAAARRELREEVGLVLPDDAPLPRFARWLTPEAEPRRFDTAFFLALLPPGQEAVADEREVFDLRWLAPRQALQQARALDDPQSVRLPPPTYTSLWELQAALADLPLPLTSARLHRLCRRDADAVVLPKLHLNSELQRPEVLLPWDPAYTTLPGAGAALPPPPSGANADAALDGPPPRRFSFTPEGRFIPHF